MDKERRAYDILLQTVNSRARSSPFTEQVQLQRQLQFLHDFDALPPSGPYGVHKAAQLAQLLTAEANRLDGDSGGTNDSSKLNEWLVWLNELLSCRKQMLGDTEPLLQWLLQRVEQQKTVDDLHCLLTLLESVAEPSATRRHFPRLAVLPLPDAVDAALLLVLCQDAAMGACSELEEQEEQLCSQLGNALLQAHYDGRWMKLKREGDHETQTLARLVAHSLQLLQKITAQHADYAQQHAPELLGLALVHARSWGDGQTTQLPHRVQPAQQSVAYGQDEEQLSSTNTQNGAMAGRRAKSRKMRSLTKPRNNVQENCSGVNTSSVATSNLDRMQELLLQGNSDHGYRTPSGDSEGACTPTSDGAIQHDRTGLKQQRQSQVKVRLAALQLLGTVTKQLPRRLLYGYWHALFPSGDSGVCEASKDHLLQIGASDGNIRCRALALQLAAQLLYGSKPYLSQASSASAPNNYTPFALSLANSVLEAYRQLTFILQREYAPPVLLQCLKCLAVLVQATPFEQLQMGFVYEFVPHVKKLAGHMDTSIQVSALLVMEMLVAMPRLTQEIACAVGLPISERRAATRQLDREQRKEQEKGQQFQQLCDSDDDEQEEEEVELEQEEEEEEVLAKRSNIVVPFPRIPRNSWLLRLVLRYLDCPGSATPLRVECLQVLLAMATHFRLLRDHLARLAETFCDALKDASADVRLYGARCFDAIGYQMARQSNEQQTDTNCNPNPNLEPSYLKFWQRMLPAIYCAYQDASTTTLRCSLCDALSNMGVQSFESLSQVQRNGLLAFLLGCSSDDAADHLVRAAALRALAVYVLHPSLRGDLVFVEHAAELTLRLNSDNQLAVRIKAAWALGNISEALVAPLVSGTLLEEQEKERISQALLGRLIEAAVVACSDHDKVRANAVRSLGNLLRLLPPEEHALMQPGLVKLLDCVRAAGGAKVKWNACYALGNLVRNRAIFSSSASLAGTLYAALNQLMVQHGNFKVRINATAVLLQIEHRADFGVHYASVWRSLLAAIERSNTLDTFEEYNHRDGLQQQLCLAMAHMLARARPDDLSSSRDALECHLDTVTVTWRRVAYRIVPEQAAPLFTCSSLLKQRLGATPITGEQKSALTFLTGALRLES